MGGDEARAIAKATRDAGRMVACAIFFGVSVWIFQQGGPVNAVAGLCGMSLSLVLFVFSAY